MSREFIEEIYEHAKVLNKINAKVTSIRERFSEMDTQDSIRDMKLKTILK
jgi:predicted RNA-binding protein with RPS1 domain